MLGKSRHKLFCDSRVSDGQIEAAVLRASSESFPRPFSRIYSLSETGSDSFLGDAFWRSEINSRPEGGTPTLP